MAFILDDYIDEYISHVDDSDDKAIAQHLKEIIPQTMHLDRNTFNGMVEELKKEMKSGKNFKDAFYKVHKKFILTGDVVTADLPGKFIRFIINVREFLEYISNVMGVEVDEVKSRIDSKGTRLFIRYIGHLDLAPTGNDVVFATFDEDNLENDPFINCKASDIINMLALNRNRCSQGEPLTAAKIIYRNKNDMEKKFPIFFDAGWYDKFYPAEKNDRYGRIRSLDPDLKNMPEIVHQNVKISEVTEDIEFLED